MVGCLWPVTRASGGLGFKVWLHRGASSWNATLRLGRPLVWLHYRTSRTIPLHPSFIFFLSAQQRNKLDDFSLSSFRLPYPMFLRHGNYPLVAALRVLAFPPALQANLAFLSNPSPTTRNTASYLSSKLLETSPCQLLRR